MIFTIYSGVYLITTFVSLLVAILAWQRKNTTSAKELIYISLTTTYCAFFLFLEASSTTIAEKIFWSKISYLGVSFIPVFYLLLVLRFTRMLRFRDIKTGWLLFVFPLITFILALTNEKHQLIWSGFSEISEKTNIMSYKHGVWFWIGYTLYSYVLLLIATYMLITFNKNNKYNKNYRHQGMIVIFAGLFPWAVSIFYLSGINPVEGLDITPISTTLCSLLFAHAILDSSFLNLVPIARETLVETMPVGILALDEHDRIQDINHFAKNLLNVEDIDIIGCRPSQFIKDNYHLLHALMAKETSLKVEIENFEKTSFYRIEKHPINKLPGSRLITINDITDETNRQKELEIAKLKAEESDNLKSAFLANMSHEIRTPMNSIMGFISILQEPDLSDGERAEYLDIVRKNGDRLLTTLNDIVNISKIESGQIEVNYSDFEINEIIINLYSLFKPEADIRGLEYFRPTTISSYYSFIRSDRDKLYSIITNLIKNALKYTKKGFVKVEFSIEDDLLSFSVSDSGIGIPEDKRKTIFERFIQVDSSKKSSYEGAGLGLAITKAFVEMLGGKIGVESELDKGSRFFVQIPVERVNIT